MSYCSIIIIIITMCPIRFCIVSGEQGDDRQDTIAESFSYRALKSTRPDSSCPQKSVRVSALLLLMLYVQRLFLCLPAATLDCGLHDAQTGDGRVPEEVQRQEETEGVKM